MVRKILFIITGKGKIQRKKHIEQLINGRKHIKNRKTMADKEGPQAPATQGAHDPSGPQNHPPPQNLQVSLIPNAL